MKDCRNLLKFAKNLLVSGSLARIVARTMKIKVIKEPAPFRAKHDIVIAAVTPKTGEDGSHDIADEFDQRRRQRFGRLLLDATKQL